MRQSDFSRAMRLPALDEYARTMPHDDTGGAAALRRRGRVRMALAKAAEDGYLTWRSGWGAWPDEWQAWCRENRHPPVVRVLKRTFAAVRWELYVAAYVGRRLVGYSHFARLPEHAFAAFDVVRAQAVQPRAWAKVYDDHGGIEGLDADASREAAVLAVDLLLEALVWLE